MYIITNYRKHFFAQNRHYFGLKKCFFVCIIKISIKSVV